MAVGRLLVFSAGVSTPEPEEVELQTPASEEDGLRFTTSNGAETHIEASAVVAIHHLDKSMSSVVFFATSKVKDSTTASPEYDFELQAIETASQHLAFPLKFTCTSIPALASGAQGHILVSVLSGKCHASRFYDNVIAPLLKYLHLDGRYQVHKTTSANSIIELTTSTILPSANEGVAQHVLLLSGDGGIVDIVNALLSPSDRLSSSYKPPVVSLIPMGTGNALAHSTKVFDPTLGLSSWLRGTSKDLPLFKVEFSNSAAGAKLLSDEGRHREDMPKSTLGESCFWGAVVFSWGFHAQIVADSDTPEFRKHGVERFKMAAEEALFPIDGSGPHIYRGTVSVEHRGEHNVLTWKKLDGNEHCYVLGTLVSNLEQHFNISPKSTPFGEKMRLVHIRHLNGDTIMRLMALAYQGGKHVEDPYVEYLEVDGFAVKFEEEEDKWRRICVDGKIILVEKGGDVQVVREKRRVLQLTSVG